MTPAATLIRRLASLFYLGLALAGCTALVIMGLFFVALKDLPRVPEPLSRIIETPPTEIYAASGERIMILGGREAIPLDRVSHHFIRAVIATEDHRFWDHTGVNKLRTLKALYITLFEPGRVQGASTITQQLAKNLFFSFKRTYKRKFHELLVALQIEAQYNKRDILEAYVNQIPFGIGAHGIEQAARKYFGKPAATLSLSEAALLAGLPKSPTRYNPYRYYLRARKRQKVVLSRMVAVGYISPRDAKEAFGNAPVLKERKANARTGSYFLDTVLKRLEERYGPEVIHHGGLQVFTTLEPRLQSAAVAAVQRGLASLEQRLGTLANQPSDDQRPQGALVAVAANSGAVRAMVGGRDYADSEYNRAIQGMRQPGSGFKPFLYYSALENLELSPAAVVTDRAVTIPVAGAADWSPRNFGRQHAGPMILKRALLKSVNTVAAQLVAETGPDAVIKIARRCGIQSPLKKVYSVALGSSEVTPLEMAAAFATFATGGIRNRPFFISRVEDAMGQVLEEHIVSGKRTLDPTLTYQLVEMMQGVMDQGTGAITRRMGFSPPAAGKTGTTNGYRDAWFTGFTPTLSTSVWVGFDKKKGLRDPNGTGITGGHGAAPIWADFMIQATSGEPPRKFTIPADIHYEQADPVTGYKSTGATKDPLRIALKKSQRLNAPPGMQPWDEEDH
ncbi:MAG: PBP1A family penicillin-binding protein [Desulfobacterales bacterium]|nr:PBP1A family penicillin-binding protein [Desulfobacterales bacterium]